TLFRSSTRFTGFVALTIFHTLVSRRRLCEPNYSEMEAKTKISEWIPGIDLVRTYHRDWLTSDLVAGLSVAAVALPIGIAYAQLAGFPPVVGIYSCILPAVAY